MSSSFNPLVTYNAPLFGAAQSGSGSPGLAVVFGRNPTTADTSGQSGAYQLSQLWFSTSSGKMFYLAATGATAIWRQVVTSSLSGVSSAMVAGTTTVLNSNVTAVSVILVSHNTVGGAQGVLSVPSASIIPGTSFVINSSSGTDTSTVNYVIIN